MRKPLAFRPVVLDRLEDRTVPSAAGTAAVHHAALTPQQIVTAKLAGAYANFDQSFTQDVNADFYMPSVTGSGGTTAMFSEDLGVALNDLAKSVRKTMGSLSPRSPAVVQVHQSILGSDPQSLRMQLSALTTSMAQGGSSIQGFESEALDVIKASLVQVNKEVLATVASPASTPTKPATSSGGSGY
jgi:hypothetical protein